MVKVHAHIETWSDAIDYVWRHPVIMTLCLLACVAFYVVVVVRKSTQSYAREEPESPDAAPVDDAQPTQTTDNRSSGLRMRSVQDALRL
jgi:hypothetical protein